jgi:hypothetical protein
VDDENGQADPARALEIDHHRTPVPELAPEPDELFKRYAALRRAEPPKEPAHGPRGARVERRQKPQCTRGGSHGQR